MISIPKNKPERQAVLSIVQPASEDAELVNFSADDTGNAEAAKRLYGDTILYTREYGWLVFNGRYWEEDEEGAKLMVIDTLKRRRKADARRIQGCMMVLQSYQKARIDEFDSDPDSLNVQNGVLNLRTGKLTEHQHAQRFTYCIPIRFNPEADYSKWVSFLNENVRGGEEMVSFLQEAVGYSLTGHTSDECLFYLFGPTRAGKGTFVEVLREMLGKPLAEEAAFNSFTTTRAGDAKNFDLAPLKASRVVIASESNKNERLNGAIVKNITGGGAISCEFKFHDRFSYVPQFKIWLTTNHSVNGDPDDGALWNRLRVVEFPNSYEGREDPSVKRSLKQPGSLEGVLLWAAIGAQRWYAQGKLNVPELSTKTKQEHRDQADSVGLWIEECGVLGPDERVDTSHARASYTRWCEETGYMSKGAKAFNGSLRMRGCTPNHTARDGRSTVKVILGLGVPS
jgi:putative DNA primase/helicase